ncbi:MAG: helix-turn-helix domain-containing protein [Acidimicrobiales bacterium]
MARSPTANADHTVVEFLVEPFTEGEPGKHVHAAIDAFEREGIDVEFGAFSSIASGAPDAISRAVASMISSAMAAGATAIRLNVATDRTDLGVGNLQDALDAMIRAVERKIGSTPTDWTRAEKQAAVRLLDERGAFLLRGAVDDIATVMGVSRITIYNYLNAIEPADGEGTTA